LKINLDVVPVTKIITILSNAIGDGTNYFFGLDAAKIQRLGKAEADVERKKITEKAEGEAKALKILARAERRVAIEQFNKQLNMESVIVQAAEDLSGKPCSNESTPEKDWVVRFCNVVQDISQQDLQSILAKILSGEIQKPGSFSLKTLEVIKYISQKNLEKFLTFVDISTEAGVLKIYPSEKSDKDFYGTNLDDYLDLADIGLFNSNLNLRYRIETGNEDGNIKYISIGNEHFILKKETPIKLQIPIYPFTTAGREIRALVLLKTTENSYKENYYADFACYISEETDATVYRVPKSKKEPA
jgi:hypothetical protein